MLWRRAILDHRKQRSSLPPLRLPRKQLFGPGSGWVLILAILGAQCVVGIAFSALSELIPSTWPFAIRALLGVAAAALVFVIVTGVMVRLAVPSTAAGIDYALASARCPSCGYALKTLTPEPDGCTVCPECGAAWCVPAQTTRSAEDQP